jgi:hypothetical protein
LKHPEPIGIARCRSLRLVWRLSAGDESHLVQLCLIQGTACEFEVAGVNRIEAPSEYGDSSIHQDRVNLRKSFEKMNFFDKGDCHYRKIGHSSRSFVPKRAK